MRLFAHFRGHFFFVFISVQVRCYFESLFLLILLTLLCVSLSVKWLSSCLCSSTGHARCVSFRFERQLETLRKGFSQREVWHDSLASGSELEEICVTTTRLGCILNFRDLLVSAQEFVIRERVPGIYEANRLAWQQVQDRDTVVANDNADFGYTARDAGINCGLGDTSFRNVVQGFMKTTQDQKLWEYLPELYGAAFRSQRWTSAKFDISVEGHTNNAHCMAAAVSHLLVAVSQVAPRTSEELKRIAESKVVGRDMLELITIESFRRFIKCAAYSVLHMISYDKFKRSVPNIMVFLEAAVQASGGRVDMAYLEGFFPFTMIRFNYICLYEQQTKVAAAGTLHEKYVFLLRMCDHSAGSMFYVCCVLREDEGA
jgi:hypothetical protein